MFVVRVRLKRDGVVARGCVVRWEFVFEVEDEVVGLCGGERGGRLHLSEFGLRVARFGDGPGRLARRVCVRLERRGRVLGLVAARLLARRLFVVFRFAAAEERADLADQVAYGLEGFRQDCVRANSARLRLVEWFKRADEENDGDVPESRVAADALAQLVPVGAGHVYVGEQDVGRLVRVEYAERPLAVR